MDKKSFKAKSTVKKKDLHQEKLDILEEKYQTIKEILKQVLKDLQNEKEKSETLQRKYAKLEDELKEKNDLLEKMQSVSEAVVDEFSTLKAKCEMETEAANKAIKRATRYFQENLKLKENQNKVQPEIGNISNEDDPIVLREDSIYADVSELEILNKSNSDLRTEIASLKIQLNKEIENQILLKEDFEAAKLLYEQEVKQHKCILEKYKSLEMSQAIGLTKEMHSLENGFGDRNNINQENEIEANNLESEDNSSKLKCKEEELIATTAAVEQQKEVLINRIKELKKQILHLKSSESHNEPLCIPPPPPPPPPPSFNPIKSLFTFIYAGRKGTKKHVALEQENTDVHQKAMSEMINAIKKGSIQLKPVPKAVVEKEESISEPIALAEMRNILKTLKKRERFVNETAKETKNEDLSSNSSEVAKNVSMILYPKEVTTNVPNPSAENHTQLFFEKEINQLLHQEDSSNQQVNLKIAKGSNQLLHQEDSSKQQVNPKIEETNTLIPLPAEIHAKSSFMIECNKLPDQKFESHLDKDSPPADIISNCSSCLNGIEFPSYSSSIVEDIYEDFVVTI